MAWFSVTFHETDGNDCTVYDTVVEAETEDEAFGKVADSLEKTLTADGRGFEDDGDCGFYFDCDCEIPEGDENTWECSHGGIVMREAERFEGEEGAEAAHLFYHCRYDCA